jgi:pseudouridine synthase
MCGLTSRRKAEDLIRTGRVTVNGKRIQNLATTVRPGTDHVRVDDRELVIIDRAVYLVMNKPKDTITTVRDERGRPTVMDLVRSRTRVYPIGRLDRNTTGVLLLTNDGDFAHHLMHPRYEIPKAYQVTCDRPVKREDLQQLKSGIRLKEGTTAPARVEVIPASKGKEIGIVVHEGWNRQVRRMFEALGYDVRKIDRVAYGPVTREGLPRGSHRPLTAAEVRQLKRLAGLEPKE